MLNLAVPKEPIGFKWLMSVLPWLRRQSVLCYVHKAEAALRKGSMLFTLLIVATLSELVEESCLYSGLLVQNSRFCLTR